MFKILSLIAVVSQLLPTNGLTVTPVEFTDRFNKIIDESFAANFDVKTEYSNFGLSVEWVAHLPEKYDYHVSIEKNGLALCSGAVVEENGNQVIVTAVRCVEGENAAELNIRYNTVERELNGQLERVKNIYISYDARRDPHREAAFIYPENRIDIKSKLHFPSKYNAYENAVVTGWPTLYPASDHSNLLLYSNVPLLSESECAPAKGYLCAGVRSSATSYCYVTTGSPLVATKKGTNDKYLLGFLMTDKGCRREITPTPFFDLSALESQKNSLIRRG